jgi:biotin transport system substrate-specific component
MRTRIRLLVSIALFAALTAVGSFIAIPLPGSPVPLVIQNLFVLLAGLMLGAGGGAAAMLVYLFIGALGFPVFAGGSGGLAHLAGPTGGYLASYPLAALAAGLVAGRPNRPVPPRLWRLTLGAAAGVAIIYACGLAWLAFRLGLDRDKALAVGLLPFIAGDLIKLAAAAGLARSIRPAA